jgi:hypothetical protein
MDWSNLLMIRFIVGLLLVFGGIGGLENGDPSDMWYQLGFTLIGLLLMFWASASLSEKKYF